MNTLLDPINKAIQSDIERNLACIASLVSDDIKDHPLVASCLTLFSDEVEAMEQVLEGKSHLLNRAKGLFDTSAFVTP